MTGTAAAQPSGQGTVVYLDASPSWMPRWNAWWRVADCAAAPGLATGHGLLHIHDLDGNRVGRTRPVN